ncbi:hypothetical protein Psuf_000500 [Phytohabitans suffuscus]|uniref:Carrier domain-containing protein n=1 Tax=Phytohabitans suffuscus TaxID=624315 RepID=A0A6F8Y9I9_9ACTN|nr:acyl carrier protein [Phytohabitans suffuscus]BCB82737.1 hypothetical protein Psuf_000500 [Phytohabitans suffuscus]
MAWAPWADPAVGDAALDQVRRQGLTPLGPEQAAAALGEVLDRDEPATVLADVAWDRFLPVFTLARPSRLFDEIPEARRSEPASAESALRTELAAMPPEGRLDRVLELVRGHAAAVLGHAAADAVGAEKAFKELGFDSIAAVELRNRLTRASGLKLPTTLAFDYPTARTLAAHLLGQLVEGGAEPAADGLDAVEATLDRLPAGDPGRAELLSRLTALLDRYARVPDETDLTAASAEDMFALLDRELG